MTTSRGHRAWRAACLVAVSTVLVPLAGVVGGGQPAAAAGAPSFTLSSSGTPTIGVSPDSGLPAPTGTPDASGSTNVTTTVDLTPSGFSSKDTGGFALLECNDDPNQPDFFFFGTETIPDSCSVDAVLSAPVPSTYKLVSGNVGSGNGATCTGPAWTAPGPPPSGDTCDTTGNPPAVDAAGYPCPPTSAEQAAGDLCAFVVVGLSSSLSPVDLAAQPLEFAGESTPTLTVTGTAAGQAYPGEIVNVTGAGWPITPTSGMAGATNAITGAMSVCSAAGCFSTPATSTPPSVNSSAAMSGTMVIPATPSSGVTYPCTSGCYVELQGTETISEEGLNGTVSAVDSAPMSISASDEPVPAVTAVSPTSGVLAGGATVTVTGSAFTGATVADFCTQGASPTCTPGTNVTVVDDDQLTVTSPAGTAGTDDVVVTNATGKSATNAGDEFTYSAQAVPTAPAVTAITPTSGPAAGGTSVTITGTGFSTGATVDFGTVAATGVTVVSATEITCSSPAGSGTVNVTVTVSGATSAAGSADQFTYSGTAAPSAVQVTSISPDFGSSGGGTGVIITGSGFTGATAVDFGTAPATSYSVSSDSQIVATAPAEPNGTVVNVTVTSPQGTSGTSSASTFFYVGPPTLAAVSPSSGNASGGQCPLADTGSECVIANCPPPSYTGVECVTLTGSNFNGTVEVQFAGVIAPSFDVVSDAEIVATPPAGTAGTVPVTVTNVAGTSLATSATIYTYNGIPGAPTVTGISPNTGPTAGQSDVTVTGTNFVPGALVCFGYTTTNNLGQSTFTGTFVQTAGIGTQVSTSGSSLGVVVSNNEISVQSPPGPAGEVEVVVETPGGSSGSAPNVGPCKGTGASSSEDEFFYYDTSAGLGYWMVASDGGVFTFGDLQFYKSLGGICTGQIQSAGNCSAFPIVGMASTPDGGGYWLVGADGGVFSFGDAGFYNSVPGIGKVVCEPTATLTSTCITGIVSTPDGKGYWLVGRDGGIFTFGDAAPGSAYGLPAGAPTSCPSPGSGCQILTHPIVGMAPTPDGKGYWLVASDGGVFTFGDAQYFGSRGASPGAYPIVGMAATSDGLGYWLAASDGSVYSYGDAVSFGSTTETLLAPVDAIVATADGNGYWLFERDGAVISFGDAPAYGSLCSEEGSCLQLVRPIVGAAS